MPERIDGNTIRRAERMVSTGKNQTIRDTVSKGLAIRIQGKSAGWYYLTRTRNLKIAALSAFNSSRIELLRELVVRAKAIDAEGGNPSAFLKEAILANSVEEAEAQADVKSSSAWIWEDLRDQYLGFVKANKSEDTAVTYRSNLGAANGSQLAGDYAHLKDKPIKLITAQDVLEVRNNILKRGQNERGEQISNVRQANHTLSILKSCFRFGVENYERSGLTQNIASEVSPFTLSKKQAKKVKVAAGNKPRPLTQLEIGKVLLFLESWPSHHMRLAISLQLLTGQRIASVIAAPKAEFKLAEKWDPYPYLWEIDADKVGSERSIPLPETAAEIVKTALALSRSGNPFLFPQLKPRTLKGDMSGHMSKRTANDIWHALRSTGGPLEYCGWNVAGKTLRNSFISHMKSEWRLHRFESRASTDLITHKDEGAESVPDKIYDLDEHMQEKWRVMKAWDAFVRTGYDYAVEGISQKDASERYRHDRLKREKELGIQVR